MHLAKENKFEIPTNEEIFRDVKDILDRYRSHLSLPLVEYLKSVQAPLNPSFRHWYLDDPSIWEWLKKENLIDLSNFRKAVLGYYISESNKKDNLKQIELLLEYDNLIIITQKGIEETAARLFIIS